MNKTFEQAEQARHPGRLRQLLVCTVLACGVQAIAQPSSATAPRRSTAAPATTTTPQADASRTGSVFNPCASVEVGAPIAVAMGKSSVERLAVPMVRMLVGGQPSSRTSAPGGQSAAPAQANAPSLMLSPTALGRPPLLNDGVAEVEITLLSPTELFLLGRKPGAMNLVLQSADGRCLVRDVVVTVDSGALQAQIAELLPGETEVRVRGAENALVLTGQVSDALRLDDVLKLAGSYGNNRRVVNLLRVASPQ